MENAASVIPRRHPDQRHVPGERGPAHAGRRGRGRQAPRLHPGAAHLRPPDQVAGACSRSSWPALRDIEATENVFAVGGDPAVPMGPYEDSLAADRVRRAPAVRRQAHLHRRLPGRPPGHRRRRALVGTWRRRRPRCPGWSIPGTVITQVEFDVDRVLAWVAEVREHGVELPIRVGVPGPASVKLLLGFAWPARHLHVDDDREEVRPVGHQPARQGRPGKLHPRPAGGPRPGQARRGQAALLHLRRLQDDGRMDRRPRPGLLTAVRGIPAPLYQ